ncbi:hypothetical protein DFH08DRAFT_821230 [Mycena albidolilacea]|uniref:Uncharacterized protein n=1 Tax=Mycena albidolilacea TaxID=1033008 RepID=A0AAD6ZAD4_9AGAR|nr:hypothetical protein DFH08DRAFT_821230 [Mycena albidolilacea]
MSANECYRGTAPPGHDARLERLQHPRKRIRAERQLLQRGQQRAQDPRVPLRLRHRVRAGPEVQVELREGRHAVQDGGEVREGDGAVQDGESVEGEARGARGALGEEAGPEGAELKVGEGGKDERAEEGRVVGGLGGELDHEGAEGGQDAGGEAREGGGEGGVDLDDGEAAFEEGVALAEDGVHRERGDTSELAPREAQDLGVEAVEVAESLKIEHFEAFDMDDSKKRKSTSRQRVTYGATRRFSVHRELELRIEMRVFSLREIQSLANSSSFTGSGPRKSRKILFQRFSIICRQDLQVPKPALLEMEDAGIAFVHSSATTTKPMAFIPQHLEQPQSRLSPGQENIPLQVDAAPKPLANSPEYRIEAQNATQSSLDARDAAQSSPKVANATVERVYGELSKIVPLQVDATPEPLAKFPEYWTLFEARDAAQRSIDAANAALKRLYGEMSTDILDMKFDLDLKMKAPEEDKATAAALAAAVENKEAELDALRAELVEVLRTEM